MGPSSAAYCVVALAGCLEKKNRRRCLAYSFQIVFQGYDEVRS